LREMPNARQRSVMASPSSWRPTTEHSFQGIVTSRRAHPPHRPASAGPRTPRRQGGAARGRCEPLPIAWTRSAQL
jgi:hypothetical protein